MFEGLVHLVSLDRPPTEILRDLIDIIFVTFILYRVLLVLRGTRAMQIGLGILAFFGLYLVAKYGELVTLLNVLSYVASSAVIIIVVVFQNDIRRALIRVGSKAWFSRGRAAQERVIDEVVAASTQLARHRMGALICLERDANVMEFVTNEGIDMDSKVTRELLVSLFIPETQTHDGAVLIRDLRIERSGLFFPMPESTKIADPTLGSRHRAAVGITEETDAVVVAVSEERGSITLCFPNRMAQNMDGPSLKKALMELMGGHTIEQERTLIERLTSGLRGERGGKSKPPPSVDRGSATLRSESGPKSKTLVSKAENTASGSFIAQRKRETSAKLPPVAKREPSSSDDDAPDSKSNPRLTMPMPSSKDRKSGEDKTQTPPPASVRTPPPARMSRPMMPTELPGNKRKSSRPPPSEHPGSVSKPMAQTELPSGVSKPMAQTELPSGVSKPMPHAERITPQPRSDEP